MKTEVPLCRRCCFCMPLRYGLLIWAYFSLVITTLSLLLQAYRFYYNATLDLKFIFIVVSFIDQIVNCALTVLLIVACHKKDAHLLKIYYTYALVVLGLNVLLLISDFIYDMVGFWGYLDNHDMQWHLFLRFVVILISVGLQLYIIALVRSEIFKLENTSGFEFRNVVTVAECHYYTPNDNPKQHDTPIV